MNGEALLGAKPSANSMGYCRIVCSVCIKIVLPRQYFNFPFL